MIGQTTSHPSAGISLPRLGRLTPIAALLLALGGCAVTPVPMGDGERQARIHEDMATLFKDVEPLAGALTLHEAFARALKYNYDYRLRVMESAFADAQLDVAKFDMLPKLTVSAGYTARDNDAGSRSVSLPSGAESDFFSGAQERHRHTTGAAFSWNILDFGVSYVRAQQQAEQSLIAEERKRKVVQNILQDVRQSFWRAYGAQKALPRLDKLLNRVNETLARSRRMEEERMLPPAQALAYQRALLDLHQQIVQRRQELILAKTELSALINLRPGTPLELAATDAEAQASLQPLDDLDALDLAALNNRPELREEDYRKKITVLEARRALLSLLPGIELNWSNSYDSNKYLFNNRWSEAGGMVSVNLLRAFSYPAVKRAQEAQAQVDDTRRVALGMAVLTQVRIATQRYHEALADYDVSRRGAEVDRRIEKHMLSATQANAESEMELLRTEAKSALSDMQEYVAFANLQTAYARVANSVGADLLPDVPQVENLKAFSQQLAQADADWRKTSFRTETVAPPKPVAYVGPIAVPAGVKADFSALLRSRLAAHGVEVANQAGADTPVVTAEVTAGVAQAGARPVELLWTVKRGAITLGTVRYGSVISESVATAWPIFAEASADAAATKIAGLLRTDAKKTVAVAPKAGQ